MFVLSRDDTAACTLTMQSSRGVTTCQGQCIYAKSLAGLMDAMRQ